jgi:hypothetical protein
MFAMGFFHFGRAASAAADGHNPALIVEAMRICRVNGQQSPIKK